MFLTQNPQSTVYIRTPEPPWSRRSVSRWNISNFKLFLHEKTQTGVSFIPGWLYDIVSRLHDDASFHISVFLRCDSKSQTLRMRYPFQSTDRPISHRNGWSFRVYMMPVRDLIRTGMKFSPRYNNWCKLTPRWLTHTRNFVGYHVNKCRGMWEGTGSEWTRAGAKVAPVSCKHTKIST